ncbi:MAG TPA: hypothetical protein VMJ14_11460 [Burkholderiales bacterium]|nr:hypothetical protein [Burkholderiales bacterium]
MKPFLAALLLLAALPVHADEPEAVYAKYHRAAASGDLNEMMRYIPEAQRAEMVRMSAAERDAAAKMAVATAPRAFVLRNKSVAQNGKTAHLVVSGDSATPGRDASETLYGSIRLVLEGTEWKVADESWNNTPPATLQAAPAQRAAPAGAQQKVSAPAKGAGGLVGSTPDRTLGKAKEPCVFKPVMTAEDMERCR